MENVKLGIISQSQDDYVDYIEYHKLNKENCMRIMKKDNFWLLGVYGNINTIEIHITILAEKSTKLLRLFQDCAKFISKRKASLTLKSEKKITN